MNAPIGTAPLTGWREASPTPAADALSTGHGELDALLPAGGWPRAALAEILLAPQCLGSLRLLLPALARLSREEDRWLCWVAPPNLPYAPTLAAAGVDLSRILLVHPRARRDGLRVVEQCLRSGRCSAVLAWPAVGEAPVLRRLQQAAAASDTRGFLFRRLPLAKKTSPVPLRLRLDAHIDGTLSVDLLGRRQDQIIGSACLGSAGAVNALNAGAFSGQRLALQ